MSSAMSEPAELSRTIEIRALAPSPGTRAALAGLLRETVAHGGSVSFMHPLGQADAEAFWEKSLAAAARGERVVLGAFDGETRAGTVTRVLDLPVNQPHRAEIAKLMVGMAHRGRGIARELMKAAEARATAAGRTMLVLDTASIEGAGPLYEALGWSFAGELPDYAYTPHGAMSGTRLYWKRVG